MQRPINQSIGLTLLLAAILCQSQGCGGETPKAAPPPVKHIVLYQAQGWRGVLIANGVPVQLIQSPQGAISVTEWTQSGANEIAVVAQSDASTKNPFQFQICSATTADAKDIKPEANPISLPIPADFNQATVGTTSFQAPPRDEWPWQRAVTLEKLTPEDEKEITEVFARFVNAFGAKNVDGVIEAISTGSAIKSRALGLSPEQAKKNDREYLTKIFTDAGRIQIIEPANVQVRLFTRGVMVFPTNLDGSMHLVSIENKANPAENYIFDSLTLCKIDGKWVRVN